MDRNKIEERLSEGSPSTVLSTPFSVLKLRNMAKAALRGNVMLTIIVGDNLNDYDIDNIRAEAPRNVAFDYSRCSFPHP